jgi:2'-5' RNA ligase
VTDVVRAFLALEVPKDVKLRLAEARDSFVSAVPRARWTRPEGWHLTLKFLGEAERGVLEGLSGDLRPQLEGVSAVRVELAGGGFFPSSNRPRVAWVGGTASGADRVVTAVEAAARGAGFPEERRPWAIHLTMARLKSRWPREAVDRYLEWANALVPESFLCSEAVLFSSRLDPGGAVYTALERYPLE